MAIRGHVIKKSTGVSQALAKRAASGRSSGAVRVPARGRTRRPGTAGARRARVNRNSVGRRGSANYARDQRNARAVIANTTSTARAMGLNNSVARASNAVTRAMTPKPGYMGRTAVRAGIGAGIGLGAMGGIMYGATRNRGRTSMYGSSGSQGQYY